MQYKAAVNKRYCKNHSFIDQCRLILVLNLIKHCSLKLIQMHPLAANECLIKRVELLLRIIHFVIAAHLFAVVD